MTKIAHIADVHLRGYQYGLAQRGNDFLTGVLNAITTAAENNADAILCAGDLIDVARPPAKVICEQLNEINQLLIKLNIPMYVISGNHDNTDPNWAKIYDNGDNTTGICMLDNATVDIKGVSVHGVPFMEANLFREHLTTLTEKCDILMWHAELKEFTGYPKETSVSIADFPEGQYKVIAMGDQHIHKWLVRDDGLIIAYPGSTEMCSAAEDTQKKLIMYTFDADKDITLESIPFKTRPCHRLRILDDIDLEQKALTLEPDSLIYVDYASEVPNVITRLQACTSANTIIRPRCIPPITVMDAKGIQHSKASIIPLGTFLDANIRTILGEEVDSSFLAFCVNLADINQDARTIIDTYCEQTLKTTLI